MKFYVSQFDVSSGSLDFEKSKVFDTLQEALKEIEKESKKLESEWEIVLGCGEEEDDWFPPTKFHPPIK